MFIITAKTRSFVILHKRNMKSTPSNIPAFPWAADLKHIHIHPQPAFQSFPIHTFPFIPYSDEDKKRIELGEILRQCLSVISMRGWDVLPPTLPGVGAGLAGIVQTRKRNTHQASS